MSVVITYQLVHGSPLKFFGRYGQFCLRLKTFSSGQFRAVRIRRVREPRYRRASANFDEPALTSRQGTDGPQALQVSYVQQGSALPSLLSSLSEPQTSLSLTILFQEMVMAWVTQPGVRPKIDISGRYFLLECKRPSFIQVITTSSSETSARRWTTKR